MGGRRRMPPLRLPLEHHLTPNEEVWEARDAPGSRPSSG